MTALRPFLKRLRGDVRGAYIVEFAFVAPLLVVTLIALFDLGYRSYVGSMVQGALHEAARLATVGDKTGAEIDAHVRARLHEFSNDATITVAHKSYSDFAGVNVPEKITSDTAPLGSYNAGDCYEDANGNSSYDLDRGKSGLGGAEDIVNYEVTMSYPRLFPLGSFIGVPDTETIRASTVLRNQPYASQVNTVAVVC